jgi:hypothetical protein
MGISEEGKGRSASSRFVPNARLLCGGLPGHLSFRAMARMIISSWFSIPKSIPRSAARIAAMGSVENWRPFSFEREIHSRNLDSFAASSRKRFSCPSREKSPPPKAGHGCRRSIVSRILCTGEAATKEPQASQCDSTSREVVLLTRRNEGFPGATEPHSFWLPFWTAR